MTTLPLQKNPVTDESERRMQRPDPKAPKTSDTLKREEVLAPIDDSRVDVSKKERRGEKPLWVARYLDVQASGESEAMALTKLEKNWRARQEYERGWEQRQADRKQSRRSGEEPRR